MPKSESRTVAEFPAVSFTSNQSFSPCDRSAREHAAAEFSP
ncbi:hypothetical protein RRSWK_03873 [Rhodopirellula sp. SWK7]|nr:hypothetical protein RRSWK_03873 [Rhodopirellula sp. SWK7]